MLQQKGKTQMKSVLMTFLMFFVVFASIQLGILDAINSGIFHLIVYIAFAVVIVCALYFVGLPKFSEGEKQNTEISTAEPSETDVLKEKKQEKV